MGPLPAGILRCPLTSALEALLLALFLLLLTGRLPVARVTLSGADLLARRHFYRALTAPLSHKSPLHWAYNASSLWALRALEHLAGPLPFLRLLFLSALLSTAVYLLFCLISRRHGSSDLFNTDVLGFSGVLFALMTYRCLSDLNARFSFFGIPIPAVIMPFFSLLFMKFLVPQSSFAGHLSGIVAGFFLATSFASILDGQMSAFLAFWSLVFFAVSLIRDADVKIPGIKIYSGALPTVVRIRNGVVYRDSPLPVNDGF